MEAGQPSITAIAAARLRAAHLLWGDPPRIFEDTFALPLSGCESEGALRTQLERIDAQTARRSTPELAEAMRRYMTATVITRSRYVEDEVEQAVRRGISQYVILGAGLDSFAYRRLDLATFLRVFEVDHPASQVWKQSRLRDAMIELPPNLSLVPVDFEQHSFLDSLRLSGYRTDAPGIFSWLGVTTYLTCSAIFDTLQTIARLARTEIIFGYLVPEDLMDEEARKILAMLKVFAARCGEPFRTFFEPARLLAEVRKLGFTRISNLSPDEAGACYCKGRTDGLWPFAGEHYMYAGWHGNK